jgi:nicotinamide riboside transporter PnuC
MRHRAILFGILGLFFVYAAFQPPLQPMAFIAGFISVVSFLGIAWSVGEYSDAIRKVIFADLLAVACLLVAVILYLIVHRNN